MGQACCSHVGRGSPEEPPLITGLGCPAGCRRSTRGETRRVSQLSSEDEAISLSTSLFGLPRSRDSNTSAIWRGGASCLEGNSPLRCGSIVICFRKYEYEWRIFTYYRHRD